MQLQVGVVAHVRSPAEISRCFVCQARKTLLVPTPRLRSGLFNKINPPADANKETLRICATAQVVLHPDGLPVLIFMPHSTHKHSFPAPLFDFSPLSKINEVFLGAFRENCSACELHTLCWRLLILGADGERLL